MGRELGAGQLKIGQRGKVKNTLKTFRELLTGLRDFFKGNFCNVSADSYIRSAKQIQNSSLGTLGIFKNPFQISMNVQQKSSREPII